MAKFEGSIDLGDGHEASVFVEDADTDAVYFHIESANVAGLSFTVGGHVDLEAMEKLVELQQKGIAAVRANRG